MNLRQSLRSDRRKVGLAIAILAVAPLPILGSTYYEGVLAHLVLLALLAVALNIAFGHTDQLFLFVGGLAGFGAYTTALLADAVGISAWVTLPLAAVLAGLIGLAVSWVSAKRHFTVVLISILTLNLQLVFVEAFVGMRNITRGTTGFAYDYFSLDVVADPLGLGTKVVLYYVLLVLLLATLFVYLRLVNSKYGIAFEAIREDELAAESIGIDVVYYKSVAGFVAAFLIGLTGAFFAREGGYILPSDFAFLTVDVVVLIVLIVGGLRTTFGPLVGAAIVVAIEEYLGAVASSWRTAIFGALLVVLFLYFRRGVVVSIEEQLTARGVLSGNDPATTDGEGG